MDDDRTGSERLTEPRGEGRFTTRLTSLLEQFVHAVEVAAAAIFALLFAIGVVDLGLQIVDSVQRGRITNPKMVVDIIDTGLLLLIIVEVYQTVMRTSARPRPAGSFA